MQFRLLSTAVVFGNLPTMFDSAFTDEALARIKLHSLPQYRMAQLAGLSEPTLTKWIRGQRYPRNNDPRLGQLALIIGVPIERMLKK